MKLVQQVKDIRNYVEALECENNRLRNALFRILEKGHIEVAKKEYEPEIGLDFWYDTSGSNLVIKKLDYAELGMTSSQYRIIQLKSNI